MTVFANGLEISAKAQGCKVIAAFPDTCFTPPQTPATPPGVPVPYPNFGTDRDLTSGTSTVKIGNEEVSQENSSKYSKISGDEAGCAPKKGVITSKNTGKAYAQHWSMNVKAEDMGVARFGDLATTNHMSNPGNDAPIALVGAAGLGANWTSYDNEFACKQIAEQMIRNSLYRNKRAPENNGGFHGFINRKIEQLCGLHGPGTVDWQTHVDELRGARNRLEDQFREFNRRGCESQKYLSREERVAIHSIVNDSGDWAASSSLHFGRGSSICQELSRLMSAGSITQVLRRLASLL